MSLLITFLSLVAKYSQWNGSTSLKAGVFRRQLAVTVAAGVYFKQGIANKSKFKGPPM